MSGSGRSNKTMASPKKKVLKRAPVSIGFILVSPAGGPGGNSLMGYFWVFKKKADAVNWKPKSWKVKKIVFRVVE